MFTSLVLTAALVAQAPAHPGVIQSRDQQKAIMEAIKAKRAANPVKPSSLVVDPVKAEQAAKVKADRDRRAANAGRKYWADIEAEKRIIAHEKSMRGRANSTNSVMDEYRIWRNNMHLTIHPEDAESDEVKANRKAEIQARAAKVRVRSFLWCRGNVLV